MDKLINDLADQYGLTVHKRITTGGENAHYATFELTGSKVQIAYRHIRRVLGERGCLFVTLRTVKNPEHPEYGSWYIEADSVWCEPKEE
jgi:hypothetical protein